MGSMRWGGGREEGRRRGEWYSEFYLQGEIYISFTIYKELFTDQFTHTPIYFAIFA